MIVCSIVPNNVCEWMYDKQFVMLLTSAFEDRKHLDHYVDRALWYDEGSYKILKDDCGYSLERMLEVAKRVHASEIVLPGQTPAEVLEDISIIRQQGLLGQYKLQAVCHAVNLEEFKSNFEQLDSIAEVDTIGLPKNLSVWCKDANRGSLSSIFLKTTKAIHLLGFWFSLKELLEMPFELLGKIRSADTSIFALNAVEGQSVLHDRRGELDTKHEYVELLKEGYDHIMQEYYQLLYNKADREGALGV